ncbi:MAG: hypothetical protein IT348_11135 [Candidatus Eisenbacteria bacterium]|nr:hypothetical protein [Candidatus Eisenbacteria bacterium]
MHRSPAERYAVCRLLEGATVGDAVQDLADRQLDVVPIEYVAQLQAELAPPTGFDPRDRTHLTSQRYLLQRGVRLYFQRDAEMDAAAELLNRPLEREFMETLIVAGADNAWLAHALERRGTPVSERAIRLFRSCFFDISPLDSRELRQFLARRRGEDVPPEAEDPRLRAAHSRGSGLALLLEMLRAGSMPAGVQISRLFEAARIAAAAGCVEATLGGEAARALAFSSVAKNLTETLQAIGDPGGHLQHELRALMLGTSTETVPHVSELGGTHTTDLLGEPSRH